MGGGFTDLDVDLETMLWIECRRADLYNVSQLALRMKKEEGRRRKGGTYAEDVTLQHTLRLLKLGFGELVESVA